MSSRSSRIRTVVAALVLALVTAVPLIGAERAPTPRLGDPVVVERMPGPSAAGPSGWPYEGGARPETSTSPSGAPGRTQQPTGTGPSDDALDGPAPPRSRATSQSGSSSGADPVAPVSPRPASSGGTEGRIPTPAVTPSATSGDDDSDGDDGGSDDS